jgi:hypothetical protein
MSASSEAELGRLIEDVLVCAFGVSEQLVVFEYAFAASGLPATAEAVGLPCSRDAVEFNGDHRRGHIARVTIDGPPQRVGPVTVQVIDQDHDVAGVVDAFERWWVPAG